MSDDWDFGFTAVDDIPTHISEPTQPVVAKVDAAQLQGIIEKLERISQNY
jgi:hypothetical protein